PLRPHLVRQRQLRLRQHRHRRALPLLQLQLQRPLPRHQHQQPRPPPNPPPPQNLPQHQGLVPRHRRDRNPFNTQDGRVEQSSAMTKQLSTVINALSAIGLVSLATASGQTPPGNPIESEPLEKYDNPPAFIYRLETGPRMISHFGPFISFPVNVYANGNNIIGDAA